MRPKPDSECDSVGAEFMALPSTLYRFRIELADVERGVYEPLDFRIAQHPSETPTFLLTRVLAYALNTEPGLAFSPGGLSDPDEPALLAKDENGGVRLWIEIGNPSAKKVHRATKSARSVRIYTYKDPEILISDLRSNTVFGREKIEIYSLSPRFLERLSEKLARDNTWNLLLSDGTLTVSVGDTSDSTDLVKHHASDQ